MVNDVKNNRLTKSKRIYLDLCSFCTIHVSFKTTLRIGTNEFVAMSDQKSFPCEPSFSCYIVYNVHQCMACQVVHDMSFILRELS